MNLLLMAAGTGGHVIPGLAIARELQSRGHSITWLGTPAGMENRLVTDIPLERIAFTGLRGKGLLHTIKNCWHLVASFWQVWRVMRQRQIDVVVGMGGYVCVSGGLMAWLTRRPLLLVNADAELLLSNKLLQPLATRIWMGMTEGNPVRSEIEKLERQQREGVLKVLIVGGSLGAKAINDCIPKAIALMPALQRPRIVHQTGAAHADAVRASYSAAGLSDELSSGHIQVEPFIDDMAKAYANCDLFIGRAGAITVSELCAAGVGSVLIPFIASTTAHQRGNAQSMQAVGAAIHLPQTELNAQKLATILQSTNPQASWDMGCKAKALAKPYAARRLADAIEAMPVRRNS